jgi:hypothetical protein
LLQARYGWTDADILAMPFLRFQQASRIAAEQTLNEHRRQMEANAFLGWQQYLCNPFRDGKPMEFAEYRESLGLGREDGKQSLPDVDAKTAIARAEKILAKARKHKANTP